MKMMDMSKIVLNGSYAYTFPNRNHYYNFRPKPSAYFIVTFV